MAFIQDGWVSLITILDVPGGAPIYLMEREVQPPGLDGGPPIDTTTMRNRVIKTWEPQGLMDYSEITLQCNYDPHVASFLETLVLNKKRRFRLDFPDGAIWLFGGCMYQWTPASLRTGEFPLAEVKIKPTNRDASGLEESIIMASGVNLGTVIWPPNPRPVAAAGSTMGA